LLACLLAAVTTVRAFRKMVSSCCCSMISTAAGGWVRCLWQQLGAPGIHYSSGTAVRTFPSASAGGCWLGRVNVGRRLDLSDSGLSSNDATGTCWTLMRRTTQHWRLGHHTDAWPDQYVYSCVLELTLRGYLPQLPVIYLVPLLIMWASAT
jgi:hypothetical protein